MQIVPRGQAESATDQPRAFTNNGVAHKPPTSMTRAERRRAGTHRCILDQH